MHNRSYYIRDVKFRGYTATQILTQAFGVAADAIGFFQAKTYQLHQSQTKPLNQVGISKAYGLTPKAVSAILAKHKNQPSPLSPLTANPVDVGSGDGTVKSPTPAARIAGQTGVGEESKK
jgi:hypothetical protein